MTSRARPPRFEPGAFDGASDDAAHRERAPMIAPPDQ